MSTLAAALAVLALALLAAAREWDTVPARARRWMQGLVGVALLGALFVTLQTLGTHTPLAHGDLGPGSSVTAISTGHPLEVLASAHLPQVRSDESVAWEYAVSVHDGEKVVAKRRVLLEEHWGKRRVGRRGGTVPVKQEHAEERIVLAAVPAGDPIEVSVDSVTADEATPLSVDVLPAPTPPVVVALFGGLLVLAGTVLDVRQRKPTHQGLVAAALTLFVLLVEGGVTPHAGMGRVVTTAFLAAGFGAVGAMLLRFVVGSFVRPAAA